MSCGGGSSAKCVGMMPRSSTKNHWERVSAMASWSNKSVPSDVHSAAMWDERHLCLQATASHTLADVMYSFAHSLLAW
jgi:hypothetical protein